MSYAARSSRTAALCLAAALPSVVGCGISGSTPPPLRVGYFAADATAPQEQLQARYRPLVTYLESHLARPIDLTVSSDAAGLLGTFENGGLDVVYHRAIAFPHAHEFAGAIPLVTREEERHATTVFLALSSDPRPSLPDFRGARFDFSLRFGSSYVMGRHYLEQQHIDYGTFFGEVHYLRVADEAVDRLKRGQTDLCVVNSQALVRMLASGRLKSSEVKIIAETPPHAGGLWFAARTLPADTRRAVRDAFLALSPNDPRQAAVLTLLGTIAYLPTTLDDYDELTDLMREQRLLDIDMRELQ